MWDDRLGTHSRGAARLGRLVGMAVCIANCHISTNLSSFNPLRVYIPIKVCNLILFSSHT
uniref:ORF59 n=1 Tax=Chlamydomonas reinhardtii TaxID=3055 RepID=Q32062_CHLRE|nr:ORF59; hypothetical; Method: conceptual translation supplied by author [Chlamydomonas reinhardtii]